MIFKNKSDCQFRPKLVYCNPMFSLFDNQIFLGLDSSSLDSEYGMSKCSNEALVVIEAYRTLRCMGPCPADQVVKDLEQMI